MQLLHLLLLLSLLQQALHLLLPLLPEGVMRQLGVHRAELLLLHQGCELALLLLLLIWLGVNCGVLLLHQSHKLLLLMLLLLLLLLKVRHGLHLKPRSLARGQLRQAGDLHGGAGRGGGGGRRGGVMSGGEGGGSGWHSLHHGAAAAVVSSRWLLGPWLRYLRRYVR